MMKWKFIVLYGINNLGKTTQARLLVDKLVSLWYNAEYVKYATYDLEPTGAIVHDYLKKGNPYNLSAREFQIFQAFNRTQYEPIIKEKINNGTWIIAEDYSGTGIAWGVGAGVDQDFLLRINDHLLKEDLWFVFDGERFREAIEKNHQHESNDELTQKVRQIHQDLAKKFNREHIRANDSIEEIHSVIWNAVENKFLM